LKPAHTSLRTRHTLDTPGFEDAFIDNPFVRLLMKTTLNTLLARPARLLALTTLVALSAGVLQTAQAGPGGHGGAGGPGLAMASPRHLDRMLDSINATAEQRTQIQQILGTAREELKGQREQARTLRQQSAALFAQPTVDARAAEALRAQMVAQHDAASKRMLQAMLDVSRVLTPEQRQKMAERMQQRRSMMERHRGERQQLEGGRPL
jgi:Spy/CpxP family protein refolding chaperone